jgi:thymidylate synthase
MFIKEDTVDDLMRQVVDFLLKSQEKIFPTKGPAREAFGVLLELTNPRARLSRTETRGKIFSCLGEFSWYMAGSNDLSFITHYIKDYTRFSDDQRTVYGAYGPRFFNTRGQNQIERVKEQLKKKDTRQAVVQLFDADDLATRHADIPCTCTLQFALRGDRMHLLANMRSNDAFLGLPHDIFSFTMLQEFMARELGVEVGRYRHSVGSLHLYEDTHKRGREFLAEGWQDNAPMPPMPAGRQRDALGEFLGAEAAIRAGAEVDLSTLGLDTYWLDLVRLLKIFSLSKAGGVKALEEAQKVQGEMSSRSYDIYIEEKFAHW